MKRSIAIFTTFAALAALMAFAPIAQARSSLRHERMQACADKSAGDTCSYTHKGESVNGTCESARRGKLICSASKTGASESSGGAMAPSGTSSGSETSGGTAPPAGTSGGSTGGGSMGGSTGSPSTGTGGGGGGGTSGGASPSAH